MTYGRRAYSKTTMRKKILMIGNTHNLQGVPTDISAYYSFFTSPVGGNWCREEIEILLNPTLRCLLREIVTIKNADYDYVITIFSGHGAETIDGMVLFINGQGTKIMMSALRNLSQRQLLIIDCYRSRTLLPVDSAFEQEGATMLSMSRDPVRQAYEEQIRDSIPQEIILYACDEGEKAEDSDDGGVYSQFLLHAAQMLPVDSHSPFVTVSEAHHKAVSMIQRDPFGNQHPQILQPRCLPHRRLPLAVNPMFC